MAECAKCLQAGHAGAAFERVDFPLQALHQRHRLQVIAPRVQQRIASAQHLPGLIEKDADDLIMEVVIVIGGFKGFRRVRFRACGDIGLFICTRR